jgi:hypothetical protein
MHSRSIPEISEIAKAPPCITSDTVPTMTDVSIRDLRNHGGEAFDLVLEGAKVSSPEEWRQVG